MTVEDTSRVPFQGAQADDLVHDIVISDVVPADERLWVQLEAGIWSRPLQFNVTQGQYTHVMRVRRSGVIARHRHSGPVQAYVLKGRWEYLEHDWTAEEGSYIYEPPGVIHTLIVPDGCSEMLTLFSVTGSLIYVDPAGAAIGYDDVFRRLAVARAHYAAIGLGADYVDQFVR
jgi:quercetin dioxygenase-like cupin family protein